MAASSRSSASCSSMIECEKEKVNAANPAYKTVRNMHIMEKAMDDRSWARSRAEKFWLSSPSRCPSR